MTFFPVNLNVAGRLCLVVGGGSVALRKIRSLLGCKAEVVVISPRVVEEIERLVKEGAVEWRRRNYKDGDLADAFLVFAATDSIEVQKRVSLEAAQRGVLLNSASDPRRCDFQVPATVRRGELLLTVSTGGGSPAFSKLLRRQLERQFGMEYATVIELLAAIREVVVPGPGSSLEHKKLFEQMVLSDIVECVRQGQWQRAKDVLGEILPAGIDVDAVVDRCNSPARRK